MKTKFAAFTDHLFLRLLLFAVLFLWAGFYLRPVDAAFAAFAATVSVAGLCSRRRRSADPKEAEWEETVLLQLSLLSEEEAVRLVHAAVSALRPAKSVRGGVLVGNTFVRPAFSPEPLSAEAVSAAAAAAGRHRLLLLAPSGLTGAAEKLLSRLGRAAVKDGRAVFALLTHTRTFPEITVQPPKKRAGRFSAFYGAFTRDKTKKYLFAAAALFFGAYVLPHAVYYLAAAGVCLAAAALCLTGVLRPKKSGRPK